MKTVSKEFLVSGAEYMQGVAMMHDSISELIKVENHDEFDNFLKYIKSIEEPFVTLSDDEFEAFTTLVEKIEKEDKMLTRIFAIIKEYR